MGAQQSKKYASVIAENVKNTISAKCDKTKKESKPTEIPNAFSCPGC